MARLLRKLSIGSTPYHPHTAHFEVNGKNPIYIEDVPFKISEIRQDEREKQVNGLDVFEIWLKNQETQEEFLWKRPRIGKNDSYTPEFLIDFP